MGTIKYWNRLPGKAVESVLGDIQILIGCSPK